MQAQENIKSIHPISPDVNIESVSAVLERSIAVDIESDGGGIFGPLREVWTIAVHNDTHKQVHWVRWKPGDDVEEMNRQWQEITQGLLPWFHNAAFDVSVLRSLGIRIPVYYDSMILGYNVNPNMRLIRQRGVKPSRNSIDAWGARFSLPKLVHPPWDEWKISEGFERELPIYNARDAEICWQVIKRCIKVLFNDPPAWNYFITVDNTFVDVIMHLNSSPMYINPDKLVEWEAALRQEQENTKQKILDLLGEDCTGYVVKTTYHKNQHIREDGFYDEEHTDKGWKFNFYGDFNPNSESHIIEAYSRLYGVRLSSTNREYLDEQFGNYPLTELVLKYRKYAKLTGTYCKPFRERCRDGFITAQWNQQLLTGRVSSSNPSLQVFPRGETLGTSLRGIVEAPTGYDVVVIDLSNIELRVLASLQAKYSIDRLGYIPSDVQYILDVFNHDPETLEGDYHQQMANMWGIERQESKAVTFGRVFGAMAPTIARKLKSTIHYAQDKMNKADEGNPTFSRVMEWITDEFISNNGVSHTMFGRRLIYPGVTIDPDEIDETFILPDDTKVTPRNAKYVRARSIRQARNAVVQGTAADVFKLLTLVVMGFIYTWDFRLIAIVHDELVFYVRQDHTELFKAMLNQVFNNDVMLPYVPVKGKANSGESWKDAK